MKFGLLSILLTTNVFATIDYLVVNHYTKQLYWAETDHPPGFIGWEGVGEVFDIKEQKYLASDYTYTENPYLIEEVILAVIILLTLTYLILRNKKRKDALQHHI
ncbi:hypothetical protein EI427_12980 [Flammeovirga pectinis]|uniref:Uncharacterized protein n=1 Tax=Flammeovirga pectinis TaxID=2494373 RepID=A0A3Q9FLW5_9BACT|nr:hypothetical protein [Flammeovirga pectinis]AZQ63119.1 hypothetical protein EI427_12980 [Flammeovirga pectinis]